MSLILDALNRADSERKQQNPVPDLHTQHQTPGLRSTNTPPFNYRLGVLIALALVATAALVGWFVLWPYGAPPATGPSQVAAQGATAVVQAEPADARPAQVKSASIKPVDLKQAGTSPVDSKPAQNLAAAVVKTGEHSADTRINDLYAPEQPLPEQQDEVNQLYAPEQALGSESVLDPFAGPSSGPLEPSPSVTRELEREPARTFANSTHIQDFNELAWNAKQKVPTISYQRHDYLAGGISSVVINGQTLGVGNIVANGQFIVQDILVDGVVLKHGNKVFKLRALNGWINM